MSISSDDDTDCTHKSDHDYDSQLNHGVDMHTMDDVDSPDGVDSDSDANMEMVRDYDKVEDTEGEDGMREDEEKVEEDDEDEEEDKDEDDGKEPRTIGQRELVNTLAHDADTIVDDKQTLLPAQGQQMREHTPRQKPPELALWPHTLEPPPRAHTPETHTISGLEFLGLVMPQTTRPLARTLREAEVAGNTFDVDLQQQLLGELVSDDRFPDFPLPDGPLRDVPLPNVTVPDVALPDVPLLQEHLDGLGEVD